MSIPKTTVTGPAVLPNGEKPTGGVIKFTLSGWDKNGSAVVVRSPLKFPLDADGDFSASLFRTSSGDNGTVYAVSVTHYAEADRKERTDHIGVIGVSSGGPFDLTSLLAIPTPVVDGPTYAAQAIAAAESAGAFANRAETAALNTSLGTMNGFRSVEEMLASGMSYTAGAGLTVVAEGQAIFAEGKLFIIDPASKPDFQGIASGGAKIRSSWDDLSPSLFGAKADGSTNDSAAISKMFEVWADEMANGNPSSIKFDPRRTYRMNDPVTVDLNQVMFAGGTVDMIGSRIQSGVTAGEGSVLKFKSTKVVRKINLLGINMMGGGTEDRMLELDGGDAALATGNRGFLYGWNIEKPWLEGFSKIGLWLRDNAFEGNITDPYFACTSRSAGAYPMLCQDGVDAASGNVSSLTLRGGVMRNGINNLYCPDNADIRCYGTTFLLSGEAAVVESNAIGGVYSGIHIENAWENGGGPTYSAGIIVNNSASLRDIYATSNNGNHNTAVQVFAASDGADIDRVTSTGGVTTSVYVANGALGSHVAISGVNRRMVKAKTNLVEQMISFPFRQDMATAVTSNGASNLDMDVAESNDFTFTATGNITFNSPTGMFRGDVITVSLKQDAAGGRTVNWGLLMKASTVFNTSANKVTMYQFRWSGGVWHELGGSGM